MTIDKKGVSIQLIACASADGVIGVGPNIPWSFKKDMQYFREKTSGQVIVMGSKTARTLGEPLPKRTNFVLTSIKGSFPNTSFIERQSIQEVIDWCVENNVDTLMVIGGGKVYADTVGIADVVYLNIVADLKVGNTDDQVRFPMQELYHCVATEEFDIPTYEIVDDIDRLTEKSHQITFYTFKRKLQD